MALTLEVDQRLASVELVEFFNDNEAAWLETARQTRLFVGKNFPAGAAIRRDDVAKALITIVEVHEGFRDVLNEKKLRGKFWIKDFADLIIDRTWDRIIVEPQEEENKDDEE